MERKCVLFLISVCIVLALNPAIHAEPILAMPTILNDLALDVYAETIHMMLINTFGLTLDPLTHSGSFTETGWTATTTGVYRGMPVNLSGTGIFDTASNTGTLLSTGTVGAAAFESSGSWAFTGPDPLSLELAWTIQATIQTTPVSMPDVIAGLKFKFETRPPNKLFYTDEGKLQFSRNGTPFGPKFPASSSGLYDFDSGKSLHIISSTFLNEISENNIPAGTRTTTTKGTPEPGTFALLAVGVATLCVMQKGKLPRHRLWRRSRSRRTSTGQKLA